MRKLPADTVYFGKAATGYDKGRFGNPVTIEDDEVIQEFLKTCETNSVLIDIPCGTGRATKAVLDRGLAYIGLDISSDMLQVLKSKFPNSSKLKIIESSALSIPLEDSSTDYLVSFKFLKWLPNDDAVLLALKEFRRVCCGRALVNVKISDGKTKWSVREVVDRARKLVDRKKLGTAARVIDKSKFENMCDSAGWEIVQIKVNIASNGIVYNYVLK